MDDRKPSRRFFRLPFGRGRLREEVDDELRFHLEMKARSLESRGWSPAEAREEARRRFGDPDAVRRTLLAMTRRREGSVRRRERWEGWGLDARFVGRQVLRRPASSAAAVAVLALGVGASTAVYGVVDATLVEPLPVRAEEELVLVREVDPERGTRTDVSAPAFVDFRGKARTLAGVTLFDRFQADLLAGGTPSRIDVVKVSAGFFEVLGLPLRHGRGFAPDEDRPGAPGTVVLSHGLWLDAFGGDPAAVGRVLSVDGRPHAVLGVAAPGADFPEDVDAWVPFFSDPTFDPTIRGARIHSVVARLAPGVTPETAARELTAVNRRAPQSAGYGAAVVPLRDAMVGELRTPLLLVLGAVLLVLLVACANVGSLLLGRALGRSRELAVRTALGASRGRVAATLLGESLLLAAAGGVLGVLFAGWGAGALVALAPPELAGVGEVGLNGRVMAFALAGTLLTGLLAGVIPLLRAGEGDVSRRLREGDAHASQERSSGRLRSGLVVVQVAVTLVLLTGAGLLGRSFQAILAEETGFDRGPVAVSAFDLPAYRYDRPERVRAFYAELLARVQSLPGVDAAGLSRNLPLTGRRMTSPVVRAGEDMHDPSLPQSHISWVTHDYFRTMGIDLREGRLPDRGDAVEAREVVVVNETFARTFFPPGSVDGDPSRDAVGRQARTYFTPGLHEIVGVVEDVRHGGLAGEPPPLIYHLLDTHPATGFHLAVRMAPGSGGSAAALFPALRGTVAALDPELPPPDLTTMDALVSRDVAAPRFYLTVLAVFAGLTLLLAVLGLYGLMVATLARRRTEIGIRMALGAGPGAVRELVVRKAAVLAALGVGAGLVAVVPATRVLEGLLYGVPATDPLTLAAVSLLLVAACLAATLPTVRRAGRVDPVEILKEG